MTGNVGRSSFGSRMKEAKPATDIADESVRLDLERIRTLAEAEFYARQVADDFSRLADPYAQGARDAALDIASHLRWARGKSA